MPGLSLGTQASARRDGKCADCGQFISRHDIHFHGPKRKFRGAPRAHLYLDGGGMVTRCNDPERARDMLVRKYAKNVLDKPLDELDEDERAEAEGAFPLDRARVERGRINVQAPESEYTWWWLRLDDDAVGPGITTAVVWAS